MPVAKISEAPANIQEIGGVKLTLSQVNKILETYDAIVAADKDKTEADRVEEPMAVAIATWKKENEIDGDEWVAKAEPESSDNARAGFHFSRKHFKSLVDVDAWAAEHAGFKGMTFEREGEFYYGRIGMDEGGVVVGDTTDGVTALYARPNPDGKPEPVMDELFTIGEVEIFRAGTWTDMSGRTRTTTVDDLVALAKNNRRDGIPMGFDHAELPPGTPAPGWVENLVVKGKSLLGDLVRVPSGIYKQIMQGGFRKRSAEIWWDSPKPELTGLSLLGANQSALPLKDIFARGGRGVYCYAAQESDFNKIGGEEIMSEKEQELQKQLDAAAAELEAQKASYAKRAEEQAEAQKVKDAELEEERAKNAKYAKAADDSEIAAFKTSLAKKVKPALHDDIVALYSVGDKDARTAMAAKYTAMNDDPALNEVGEETGGEIQEEGLDARYTAWTATNAQGKDEEAFSHYGRFITETKCLFDAEDDAVSAPDVPDKA